MNSAKAWREGVCGRGGRAGRARLVTDWPSVADSRVRYSGRGTARGKTPPSRERGSVGSVLAWEERWGRSRVMG